MTAKKRKKDNPSSSSPRQNRRVKPSLKSDGMTSWLQDLRFGRSVSVAFFTHNAWILIIILVSLLSLIGLRYKTKTKMAEIKALTVELDRAESVKLQEKAGYMSLIRESEMKRLVDEKHLGLDFQEQPPYELVTDR